MPLYSLFITTAKGIEPLLVNELTDFGLQAISPTRRFGVQSTAL